MIFRWHWKVVQSECKKYYHTRHDAPILFLRNIVSLHGMCFSWAGLTVGHDGPMKSIKYIIEDRPTYFLKYLLLCAVNIEDMIKHERNLLRSHILNDQLSFIIYSMYFCRSSNRLLRVEWSKTREDLNVSLLLPLHYIIITIRHL